MDPYSRSGKGSPGGATATSSSHLLTTKYLRRSKGVAVLWGIFTLCSAILNIVVFLQEEWVGHTTDSKSPGHFGLWKFCTVLAESHTAGAVDTTVSTSSFTDDADHVRCVGRLDDFASILSPAFRAATVFVGIAVIVSLLCLIALLLFCFVKPRSVFEICATMQFLAGICMGIGILCFPAGWDNAHVRGICGLHSDDYKLGDCGVRWGLVLAVIAFFDCWILACLALTLSYRNAKPPIPQENPYVNPASIYKGEINGAFIPDNQSLAGSRKSLSFPPVVMLPHPSTGLVPPPPPPMSPPIDAYSDFSPRGHRSAMPSPHRNPYATSIQNFQL